MDGEEGRKVIRLVSILCVLIEGMCAKITHNLQLDSLSIEFNCADLKVDTNS